MPFKENINNLNYHNSKEDTLSGSKRKLFRKVKKEGLIKIQGSQATIQSRALEKDGKVVVLYSDEDIVEQFPHLSKYHEKYEKVSDSRYFMWVGLSIIEDRKKKINNLTK